MDNKSKKDIEFVLAKTMAKFVKEQMGEEAEAVITQIAGDTIIVRFKGVLPPAERNLAKFQEGRQMIKELKEKLIEGAEPLLKIMIKNLTGRKVIDIHSYFNVESGERIEIFTLENDREGACWR